MKLFVSYLTGLLFLFTSCKKQDNQETPPTNGQQRLKTIVYQSLPSPYYQFEYGANGQVNTVSFASGAFTYGLLYQGNQLHEMKSIVASTKINTTYQYDQAGRIAFVKISSADGSTTFKRGFLSYDGQNRLTELEWEINTTAGFALQRTLNFTYYADGNVAERRDHRPFIEGKQPEALYIDKFEQYDDKVNVDGFSLLHESSEHLVLFPGIQLQRNNPAKVVRTGDGINYEISYAYAYDARKQPVQRTGSMLLTNGPQSGQTFILNASYAYYE